MLTIIKVIVSDTVIALRKSHLAEKRLGVEKLRSSDNEEAVGDINTSVFTLQDMLNFDRKCSPASHQAP
jgi:hypothetical protein